MIIETAERRCTLSDGESDFLVRGLTGKIPVIVEDHSHAGRVSSVEAGPSFLQASVVAFVGQLVNICLHVGNGVWEKSVHVYLSPARGGALALDVRVSGQTLCTYGHVDGLNDVLRKLGMQEEMPANTVACPTCARQMLPVGDTAKFEPGDVGVCMGCTRPFRMTHGGAVKVHEAEIQAAPGLRSKIESKVALRKN